MQSVLFVLMRRCNLWLDLDLQVMLERLLLLFAELYPVLVYEPKLGKSRWRFELIECCGSGVQQLESWVEMGESWLRSDLERARPTVGSGSQPSAALSRGSEELPTALVYLNSERCSVFWMVFLYDLQGPNIRLDWEPGRSFCYRRRN